MLVLIKGQVQKRSDHKFLIYPWHVMGVLTHLPPPAKVPPPPKKKKKNCYNQLFNEFNNFMPDLNILKILRTVNIMISVKQKA